MIRKFLIIFAAGLCITVLPAFAVPIPQIKSISATNAGTSFVGGVGSAFTLGGVGGINVEYTSAPVGTYVGGQFGLNTTLLSDTSSGGIARGNFTGGSFFYQEFGGNILLSGNIAYFNLVETANNTGMFVGDGYFVVSGGSLQANFGAYGNMVDISFSVVPNTISTFSSSFLASSNMTVLPVPEPATISLLTIGALALLKRKNNK